MTHPGEFDAIGPERLRSVGGLKWTLFPDAIGAFVAEMDFGTAPAVTRALHEAVDAELLGYLPPPVSRALSEACAAWQRDAYGWPVAAEQVHPVADVLSALQLTIQHFSSPGSPVILPTPAYMPFFEAPAAVGREVLTVPMPAVDGEYRLDLAALDAAFAAGGELLILCNPWNPVGRVLRPTELAGVAEVVDRHGGRVFADEIHSPLVHPGHRHQPYAALSATTARHTVTATSASKAWNLPGLKCAQLILSDEADLATWAAVGPRPSQGASTLGVVASTAAYTGGRPWLAEVLAYLDGNRRALAALLAEQLPGVRYTPPEGSYIGWLDCRPLGLADPAGFFREHAGVALTDGAACGAPGFVRLVFATPRPILEQAVRQMGQAVRDRRGAAGA